MSRGILVVGNESGLFSAICTQAEKRVEKYAAALIPGSLGPAAAENAGTRPADGSTSENGKNLLSWNPSSPISARTLVLGAENRLEQISEAILICSPQTVYRSAGDLGPAEIDKYINDQIKGWYFLVRELSLVFKVRESGILALVVPESEKSSAGKDAPSDLLSPPASAAFRALANGLLSSPESGSFRIMGFTGSNPPSEGEYAAWLFKILDEGNPKNSGRWHKYSKFSLFK